MPASDAAINLIITAKNQAKAAFDQAANDIKRLKASMDGAKGSFGQMNAGASAFRRATGGAGGGGGGSFFGGGGTGGGAGRGGGGIGGGSFFGRGGAGGGGFAGGAAAAAASTASAARSTNFFGSSLNNLQKNLTGSTYALRRFSVASGAEIGTLGYATIVATSGAILGLGFLFSETAEQAFNAFTIMGDGADVARSKVASLDIGAKTLITTFEQTAVAATRLVAAGYSFAQTTELIQTVNDAVLSIPGNTAEASLAILSAFESVKQSGMGVNQVIQAIQSAGIPVIGDLAKELGTTNYGISVMLSRVGNRLPSGMFDDLLDKILKARGGFNQWRNSWSGVMSQIRGEIASGFGSLLLPFFQKLRDFLFIVLGGLKILRTTFAGLPQPIKDLVKWGGLLLLIAAPLVLIIAAFVSAVASILVLAPVIAVLLAIYAAIQIIGGIISIVTIIVNGLPTVFNLASNAIMGILGGLGGFIAGVWNSIVTGVSTFLSPVISAVTSIWASILTWIYQALGVVGGWIAGVWGGIVSDVGTFLNPIIAAIVGVWNQVLTDVGTWLGGIPAAISGLWNGIVSDVSTFLNPIVGAVVGVWSQVWTDVGTWFGGIGPWIQGVWNGIVTDVGTYLGNLPGNVVAIWNQILTDVGTYIGPIIPWIEDRWNDITTGVSTFLSPITGDISAIWNSITTDVISFIKRVLDWFDYWYNQAVIIVNNIIGAFGGIGKGIGAVIGDVVGVVKGVLNGIIDAINGFMPNVSGVVNAIIDAYNNIRPAGLPALGTINIGQIPHLQEGGISLGGGLAMLHPNEAVIPLPSNMNVGNFGARSSSGGGMPSTIVLRIDDFEDIIVRTNNLSAQRGRA